MDIVKRLRNLMLVCNDGGLGKTAADEIERLRAENAALRADVAHWKNNHATEVRRARILKERIDMPIDRVDAYEQWGKDSEKICRLGAEVAALRADAERYRWLRADGCECAEEQRRLEIYQHSAPEELDAAIDAAKEKK